MARRCVARLEYHRDACNSHDHVSAVDCRLPGRSRPLSFLQISVRLPSSTETKNCSKRTCANPSQTPALRTNPRITPHLRPTPPFHVRPSAHALCIPTDSPLGFDIGSTAGNDESGRVARGHCRRRTDVFPGRFQLHEGTSSCKRTPADVRACALSRSQPRASHRSVC